MAAAIHMGIEIYYNCLMPKGLRAFGMVLPFISLLSAGCKGERVENTPSYAMIASVTAHSTLAELKDRYKYAAWKAMDGDPATAWSEGVDGPGIGETITVKFSNKVKMDRIDLRPGLYDEKWYGKNNRLKRIAVSTGNTGYKGEFELTDGMDIKTLTLPAAIWVTEVSFTIKDVYRGSAFDDTCLAEIGFFHRKKRLSLIFEDLGNLAGHEEWYRENYDRLTRRYPDLFNADPAGKKIVTHDFMRQKASGEGLTDEECFFGDGTYYRGFRQDDGFVWVAGVWAKAGSKVNVTVKRRLAVSGVGEARFGPLHLTTYFKEYKIDQSLNSENTSFDWNERLAGIIDQGAGLEEDRYLDGTYLQKIVGSKMPDYYKPDAWKSAAKLYVDEHIKAFESVGDQYN